MTPERWQHVKGNLHVCQRDDAATRASYLAHACGDHAELRSQVERLLNAHEQKVRFWISPRATTCRPTCCKPPPIRGSARSSALTS